MLTHVLHMVGALKTLHEHVVDVHLHGMFDQLLVDHSLEGYSGVLQSGRHHLIVVNSLISDKHHLVFVWWMHIDLIIS